MEWDTTSIRAVAYFDGPVSNEDRDRIGDVETEVLADFVPRFSARIEIQQVDSPIRLTGLMVWVYRRWESDDLGV